MGPIGEALPLTQLMAKNGKKQNKYRQYHDTQEDSSDLYGRQQGWCQTNNGGKSLLV